jgi:hypothetical protein
MQRQGDIALFHQSAKTGNLVNIRVKTRKKGNPREAGQDVRPFVFV